MSSRNSDCDEDTSTVRSTEVLGKTIHKRRPPRGTAFTGSDDAARFGLIALLLLLAGTALAYGGHRRRVRYLRG
jgi:hypothetical protein